MPACCMAVQAQRFQLEPLPYAYSALEPVIDTQTMRLHHDFHEVGQAGRPGRGERGVAGRGHEGAYGAATRQDAC
jgi:Fe-Mn family superoxide dismutase